MKDLYRSDAYAIVTLCILLMAASCGTIKHTTANKEDVMHSTEEEFINPVGHFTVKKIDSIYTLVPDRIFEADTIKKYLTNGGWTTHWMQPIDINEKKVCTGGYPIGGAVECFIFKENGIVYIYSDGYEMSCDVRKYHVVDNVLYIGASLKRLICYVDHDKSLWTAGPYRGEPRWSLYIYDHRNDEQVMRFLNSRGFKDFPHLDHE